MRSVSNLPTARLSWSLSSIFNGSPRPVAMLPGRRDIELIAQRDLSEPANLLPFRASVGSLRHMRPSTVPISRGRPSRPALEGMIERGGSLVSEQPRDLPERHPWIVQILGREALRNSSTTSPYVVPSWASLRARVRTLTAKAAPTHNMRACSALFIGPERR